MKRIPFILFLFYGITINAQSSDVLLLKRNNKTIKRYFAGKNIELTTKTDAYLVANISKIDNDTLYLKQYVVRQIPTRLGVFVLDTVSTYNYIYHYNQIKAIGKTGRRFNSSASAASLMGGGVLLLLASGIVYLADNQKFSPELMIASASLTAVGYIIAKTGGKGYLIGKKYKLDYLDISENKKL